MSTETFVVTPKYRLWRKILLGLALFFFLMPFLGFLATDEFHLESVMPVRHRFFLKCLDLVTKNDLEGFLAISDPEIRDSVKKNLESLGESIRAAGPLQFCHLVNFQMTGARTTLTYYLDYLKGSGVADLQIVAAGGKGDYLVQSFNIHSADRTYRQAWRFDLEGKPYYLYFFLPLALGLLLWNASVLARCLFTPLKRKWLWFLFILVGFCPLSVLWLSDPSIQFNFSNIIFPVVSISKMPLSDPWRIELAIPVGMMVFLWRERKKRREADREGTKGSD